MIENGAEVINTVKSSFSPIVLHFKVIAQYCLKNFH